MVRSIFLLLAAAALTTSCAGGGPSILGGEGKLGNENFVSKGKFMAFVAPGSGVLAPAAAPTLPVEVIVAPDTDFVIDSSAFVVPAATPTVLDFGSILVTELRDNKLRVCGADGKTKCTKAIIRTYTMGVAGAGVWNAEDGYGAPISTSMAGSPATTVGLEAVGAVTVQSYTIPASQNVLKLSDFVGVPKYSYSADFTNAGAGTYSTTLVVEYGLSN